MLLDDLGPLLGDLERQHHLAPDAYPAASIAALQSIRAFSAPFPKELGGRGSSLREMVDAVVAIASACPTTALLAAMPMGLAGALTDGVRVAPSEHERGAREQCERVARDMERGVIYAACNSEKGAGGSLAATKTRAIRQGNAFVLHGEKILASFGNHADVFFSSARVDPAELPGAGIVEWFFLDVKAPGVTVLDDWNGFGMRGSESHSVRLEGVVAKEVVGFPNFIDHVKASPWWSCMFAAIPLGCAQTCLKALGHPTSPALRARLSEALMRYESLRAYLRETATQYRPRSDAAFMQRVIRTKTHVAEQSTRLCAELFALSGGRSYTRGNSVSGALADAYAGVALRPPLQLGLDTLLDEYDVRAIAESYLS